MYQSHRLREFSAVHPFQRLGLVEQRKLRCRKREGRPLRDYPKFIMKYKMIYSACQNPSWNANYSRQQGSRWPHSITPNNVYYIFRDKLSYRPNALSWCRMSHKKVSNLARSISSWFAIIESYLPVRYTTYEPTHTSSSDHILFYFLMSLILCLTRASLFVLARLGYRP